MIVALNFLHMLYIHVSCFSAYLGCETVCSSGKMCKNHAGPSTLIWKGNL